MAGTGTPSARAEAAGPPIPGLVIVWSGEAPMLEAIRLPSLGIILGRELLGPRTTDDRISRQHARVRWNGTAFAITDLGSRNGTYVGGSLVSESEVTVTAPCVLRTGRTVSVLVNDVRVYEDGEVQLTADGVVGRRRAAAHEAVRRHADAGDALLLVAEPGAGVDAAVTVFHGGRGPLVEVEASRVDATASARWWAGDAERAPGAAAANGGTLVIHDLAALDAAGQAAVAAILAGGELASRGGRWPVDARVVAACDADDVETVRGAVGSGAFRDDLWRRLQHRVDIPPLRVCVEEIPHWVIARIRDVAADLTVHSTLIEACLLRPWPGNVDELRHEVRAAATLAQQSGKRTVRGEHLDAEAGMLIALGAAQTIPPSVVDTARIKRTRIRVTLEPAGVRAALEQHAGDLDRAAVALGVHRNRLRRFVHEHPDLGGLVAGDDIFRTGVIDD